jgi:hypothetical protein
MSLFIARFGPRAYSLRLISKNRVMEDCRDQRHILYLASLGTGHEYDAAILLLREARLRSRELQVSGAWLFDGHRMCILVRGTGTALNAWLHAVREDARNVLNAVLFDGPAALRAESAAWEVGYCEPDDLDAFADETGLRGESALAAFNQLVARCDLRP